MPTKIQAGLYSATMHYLKAIEATGTDEAPKVMAQMRATPINDSLQAARRRSRRRSLSSARQGWLPAGEDELKHFLALD
jgi:Periplasmic binding protein